MKTLEGGLGLDAAEVGMVPFHREGAAGMRFERMVERKKDFTVTKAYEGVRTIEETVVCSYTLLGCWG